MRLIFAGGGTAGHINPAIAIAKQMMIQEPSAEILFIGTKRGLEKTLVPIAGFKISYIDVEGFKRKITFQNIKVALKVLKSINEADKIIKAFKPDVVIGTGGYVSGPVMMAAVKNKIPTIIHEQNVIPGITVKLLKRSVNIVAISFTQSIKYLKGAKKVIHTGNPIRSELLNITYKQARKNLGLDERPFIAAIGGSLGAQALNTAFAKFILNNKNKYQILLSTGKTDYQRVMSYFEQHNLNLKEYPNIKVESFVYNMADVYGAADLLVTRAGAITISELAALGKPSILIPSPNVAHDHQKYNAKAMESDGASIMILEEELKNDYLSQVINSLILDQSRLKQMSNNAYRIGTWHGTRKLCEIIKKAAK